MKLSPKLKFLIIFLIFTIPFLLIFPYLPLNWNDGENILIDHQFVKAYPFEFKSPVDLQVFPLSDDLLIIEQQGKIIRISHNSDGNETGEFLDITNKVSSGGEMGLLSLTFHPNFEMNGYFYLDYTASNPRRTVISRFTYNFTLSTVDVNSEKIILEVEQPASNHNGGQIIFGTDGYLYISLGDGGGANDIYGNAQNRETLLGSILRINVEVLVNEQYSVPETNPYYGNSENYREEIFAYGLRNPWRMSQDPITNRIWVGDVGQNLYEEIDIIVSGKNYGWNEMEGFHCFQLNCNKDLYEPPIAEYSHGDGIAVTGGYVYHGSQFPELYGRYFFADYGFGNVWTLDSDFTIDPDMKLLLKQNLSISSFGLNSQGEILLLSLSGFVYQLERLNE